MTVVGNEADFSEYDHIQICLAAIFKIKLHKGLIRWKQLFFSLFLNCLPFFSDAAQPGTEIFNMPASTTAGILSDF